MLGKPLFEKLFISDTQAHSTWNIAGILLFNSNQTQSTWDILGEAIINNNHYYNHSDNPDFNWYNNSSTIVKLN